MGSWCDLELALLMWGLEKILFFDSVLFLACLSESESVAVSIWASAPAPTPASALSSASVPSSVSASAPSSASASAPLSASAPGHTPAPALCFEKAVLAVSIII